MITQIENLFSLCYPKVKHGELGNNIRKQCLLFAHLREMFPF